MARSAVSTSTVNTIACSLLSVCALALATFPRFVLSRLFLPQQPAPLADLLERAAPLPGGEPAVLLARLLACALLGLCSGALFARDALLLSRALACFLIPAAALLTHHVMELQDARSPELSHWLAVCMVTTVGACFMVVHAFVNSACWGGGSPARGPALNPPSPPTPPPPPPSPPRARADHLKGHNSYATSSARSTASAPTSAPPSPGHDEGEEEEEEEEGEGEEGEEGPAAAVPAPQQRHRSSSRSLSSSAKE
jgi:hypothetical protein